MGFLGNFFNPDKTEFDKIFADRKMLKQKLGAYLMRYGFTEMEITEVLDVITLAEADIKIASDSLNHIHVNNPDPTRAMHAALEDIKRYQKELAYDLRKKILDIIKRKKDFHRN